MPRVLLLNCTADQAKPLIKQLRAGGYSVDHRATVPSLRERPPHAFVIDLTHSPTRGRHFGVWIRSQESIRSIPIVFVDGDLERVEKIRAELPDAIYTSGAKLAAVLKRAKPLASPALPPYSRRTTAQKLGIREGSRSAVIDAPPDYAKAVGALPEGASFEEDPTDVLPVTLWFVDDPETYLGGLPRMRKVAGRSRLWVIYPKKQVGHKAKPHGVTLFFIRESALAVGLVHYKTCSVNETWSGMLFAARS